MSTDAAHPRSEAEGCASSSVGTTKRAEAAAIRKAMGPDVRSSCHDQPCGLCEGHAALDALVAELAAYKRAKAENDERFMIERDEARAELDRLRGENERAMTAAEKALKAGDTATVGWETTSAALREARAELERVTRDRRAAWPSEMRNHHDRMERAEAELVAVRERAERMRNALATFMSHPRYLSIGSSNNTVEIRVSAAKFAAARAVLEEGQQPASKTCDQLMRGMYGAVTKCARPKGHVGKHNSIWNHTDWPQAGGAAAPVEEGQP